MPTSQTVGAKMYVTSALRSDSIPIPITTATTTPIDPPAYSTSPSYATSNSTNKFTSSAPIAISPAKTIQPLLTSSSSSSSLSSEAISSSFSSLSSSTSSNDSSVYSESESLLTTLFPSTSPIHLLPTSAISLAPLGLAAWQGSVIENAKAGTRTLYVVGGSDEEINLRESVCGVLELAEEDLGCTGVVMVLEKDSPDLGKFPSLFLLFSPKKE
jgi:hypothetical protein